MLFAKSLIVVLSVTLVIAQNSSSSSSTGASELSSSSTGAAVSSSSTGAEISSSSTGAAPCGNCPTTLMAGWKKGDTVDQLLIRNGEQVPASRTFLDKEYYTVIYFWLNTAAQPINFTATITSTLTGIKQATKNLPVRSGTNASEYAELQLRYTGCPKEKIDDPFIIKCQINVPTFDPINLEWGKLCDYDPVVPVDPSSSGFEDFCLVVFILSTIFCVGGCGYNYMSRGKSGMEIVPLYSTVSKWCCKGERRYSPRMDYDTPIGDDDSYGASYQADL